MAKTTDEIKNLVGAILNLKATLLNVGLDVQEANQLICETISPIYREEALLPKEYLDE